MDIKTLIIVTLACWAYGDAQRTRYRSRSPATQRSRSQGAAARRVPATSRSRSQVNGGRSPATSRSRPQGGRSSATTRSRSQGGRSPATTRSRSQGGRSPATTRSRSQGGRSPATTRSRSQAGRSQTPVRSGATRCFQRDLQYGRSFYHVMDEPIGKTTSVLRGSGRVYTGKPNRDITFSIFGPSPYDGSRFKGFVVTRLCVFTKNVASIRMGVTGIPTKNNNGYIPAATAYVQVRVRKSNAWQKSCLNPYKTPLDQLTVTFRRRGGKPSRVLAQKLYMEACERR